MKKTIIVLALLLSASTGSFAQTKATTKMQKKTKVVTAVKYTCPMHKDVVSDKPGKCPKCGMTLVKMKNKNTAHSKSTMKM